jgi:hypothetical protein
VYVLALAYQNAKWNGSGRISWSGPGNRSIAKWTLLDGNELSRELLRLLVVSCNGQAYLNRLPFSLSALRGHSAGPLRTCHIRVLHHRTDRKGQPPLKATGGMVITECGKVRSLSRSRREISFEEYALHNPLSRTSPGRDFLLAYGDSLHAHDGNDDFDFNDPFFRKRRFHSLFSRTVFITDPSAFLGRLFYSGVRKKRFGPSGVLERLCRVLHTHLCLQVEHWLQKQVVASREWKALPPDLHPVLLPVFDAVRHTMDAFPKESAPLDLPGVIILDRPDRYCSEALLPAWLSLWDELFPHIQFFLNLPPSQHILAPDGVRTRMLPMPVARDEKSRGASKRASADILLIDVDSRLPNLALMKLSRYFKEQGRQVTFARGAALIPSAREVYASCVFTLPASSRKVTALKGFYGDRLVLGGSGIDPLKRLPPEVEMLPPDYGLYPELGDRAIGFLSRGCPLNCPFCIVPLKEGPPRQVSDLGTLTEGGRRRKLILLDDNILSLPGVEAILEEMASSKILVNFTQTLDLRFVNGARAGLLRKIDCYNTRFTRPNYYFSLNDAANLALVRDRYEMFGFRSRENVEFVCMYGYNTTFTEDVSRFSFLQTLPGAYVFTQRYQPIPGGPAPKLDGFLDGNPERLIEELIGINYHQNMKSMETYYRWVSRRYVESFGNLHMPLVDTIFRYNRRQSKGLYIATMAGMKEGRSNIGKS